jgi:hypothetical protein
MTQNTNEAEPVKSTEKPKLTDVAGKIFDLLTPFESAERHRIIQASLMLLGESPVVAQSTVAVQTHQQAEATDSSGTLPAKAAMWLKHNGLKMADIEAVFHIDNGNVDVIASTLPGRSTKEKVHNAYVLQGISRLLATGDTAFDDKSARGLCDTHGSYDSANHAVYMKGMDNKITGSKDKGWKLTSPGMSHGASLVKELTKKTE